VSKKVLMAIKTKSKGRMGLRFCISCKIDLAFYYLNAKVIPILKTNAFNKIEGIALC
jgi:hypothetical protein